MPHHFRRNAEDGTVTRMATTLRILLLADSHIGFDLPARPRVARRRRGHDFLANHARALACALSDRVDLVVHGGDVFHRSGVARSVAYQAFEPIVRVAASGVPVFIVPGNHERSRLPHAHLARVGNVHVFDRPRTHVAEVRGIRIALSGFPFERRGVRRWFPQLLERSGWQAAVASVHLLCMHQCAEGAIVGPGDFTFTSAPDVIRCRDVPSGFAAVLSGHIHRHQALTRDLLGRRLATPILYPGSIERTSFAEMDEPKGFMIVHLSVSETGTRVRWEFRHLPARPMIRRTLAAAGRDAAALDSAVRAIVADAPPDAVLRIQMAGAVERSALRVLSAAHLRTFAPATMNVEVRAEDGSHLVPRPVRLRRAPRTEGQSGGFETHLQLELE